MKFTGKEGVRHTPFKAVMGLLINIALVQNIVITLIYLGISLQFFRQANKRPKASTSFRLLGTTFALCGLTKGIIYALPGNTYLLLAEIALNIPLFIASLWYFWRGEILVIAEAIESDSISVENKIKLYKERLRNNEEST